MIEMTLDIAQRAANAALARAGAMHVRLTVSVVDEAGRLVLTLKGDGTGFFTTDSSRAKAVACAAFRRSTRELVEMQQSNPVFFGALPAVSRGDMLPSTGAVPILLGGRVIGAIGCGGGSPDDDHECASAGAAAVAG